MTKTTIDIDDLKALKHYLVDMDLKLKDFVNDAIVEKLERDTRPLKKIVLTDSQYTRVREIIDKKAVSR